MTTTSTPTAAPAAPPSGLGWTRHGRYAAAAVLTSLGVLWLAASLIGYGKHDLERLQWTAQHPLPAGLGLAADMLAVPFVVGTALVWLLLSRPRSPRLAWAGAALLTCAAAGQGVIVGMELADYLVARGGTVDLGTWSALTDSPSGLPVTVLLVLFLGGAFGGILVAMTALWRSRAVPRAAIALVVLSQLADGVSAYVPATAIGLAGLGWMSLHLLRADR
jgi:hypothetical protein